MTHIIICALIVYILEDEMEKKRKNFLKILFGKATHK